MVLGVAIETLAIIVIREETNSNYLQWLLVINFYILLFSFTVSPVGTVALNLTALALPVA